MRDQGNAFPLPMNMHVSARTVMLQMLDGNEHAACEAVGQGFKSLLQYQYVGLVQWQSSGLQTR